MWELSKFLATDKVLQDPSLLSHQVFTMVLILLAVVIAVTLLVVFVLAYYSSSRH